MGAMPMGCGEWPYMAWWESGRSCARGCRRRMRELLERWEARSFSRVLEGRTRPPILTCVPRGPSLGALGTEPTEFVVKAMGCPEVAELSLFAECLGNQIARQIGISTPVPALVSIGDREAGIINGGIRAAGEKYSLKPGVGVGSAFIRHLSPDLSLSGKTPDLLLQAARIYAFDMLVENADRRGEKPNCARRGKDLVAFDFELCFGFLLAIGYSPRRP